MKLHNHYALFSLFLTIFAATHNIYAMDNPKYREQSPLRPDLLCCNREQPPIRGLSLWGKIEKGIDPSLYQKSWMAGKEHPKYSRWFKKTQEQKTQEQKKEEKEKRIAKKILLKEKRAAQAKEEAQVKEEKEKRIVQKQAKRDQKIIKQAQRVAQAVGQQYRFFPRPFANAQEARSFLDIVAQEDLIAQEKAIRAAQEAKNDMPAQASQRQHNKLSRALVDLSQGAPRVNQKPPTTPRVDQEPLAKRLRRL